MTNQLRLDLKFAHEYAVRPVASWSESDQVMRIYFPGEAEVSTERSVALQVEPYDGRSWVGIFAGDYGDQNAANLVASCPNRLQICVVAGGDGYIVETNQPSRWLKVQAFPIREALPIPECNLLVFADETQVVAYGPRGLAWQTRDLVSDDLKITNVTNQSISGVGWDASEGHEVEFEVDLESGKVSGGIQYINGGDPGIHGSEEAER